MIDIGDGFCLYWIVIWQPSVVDVSVFSHRSEAAASHLRWECIGHARCVVQACFDGSVENQRSVELQTGCIHTPMSLLMTTLEQKCSWSGRKALQQGKFKSQWKNAVYSPEACREAHWSHCVFILSDVRTFCMEDDMLAYSLHLFVSIHIVMAGW